MRRCCARSLRASAPITASPARDSRRRFLEYVDAVADKFDIDEPSPRLIAFLMYTINEIAHVKKPTKGHNKKRGLELVHGEFPEHHHWENGIKRSMDFLKDKKLCPTRCALRPPLLPPLVAHWLQPRSRSACATRYARSCESIVDLQKPPKKARKA